MLRLLCLLSLALCAGPALGQQAERPELEQPQGLRDQVRELVEARLQAYAVAAETGADFAGRYRIELMGCGTQCQTVGVFDPRDGSPLAGLTASHGAVFRADSRLLIINDPVDLIDWEDLPSYLIPRCYVFEEEVFSEVVCGFGFSEG